MPLWQFCDPKILHAIFSIYNPENEEEIIKLYPKLRDLRDISLDSQINDFFTIFDNLHKNGKISRETIKKFIEKNFFKNRWNCYIFGIKSELEKNPNIEQIFEFFLKYKQKSFVDFLFKIHKIETAISTLNFDIDISRFPFIAENNISDILKEEKNFEKILPMNEKEKKIFSRAIAVKDFEKIQKITTERRLKIFQKIFDDMLIERVKSDFREIPQLDESKILREDFLESYKMSIHPTYNKAQFHEILGKYLEGKFDNINDLAQFNTPKNHEWIAQNLTFNQARIWFSPNTKEFEIEWENTNSEIHSSHYTERINHHMEISIKKIEKINELGFNFKKDFENSGELIKYFNLIISKEQSNIIKKDNKNIFQDLSLQIQEIRKLKNNPHKNIIKNKKIIIERENDPLRIMMMGNWVQWSCLSFYRGIGNYWSTVANAIDANKWVFYIYNEQKEVIARVIITIGSDRKMARYRMYHATENHKDIEKIFNQYYLELAEKMELPINGGECYVECIESEDWYQDGVLHVNNP